MQLLQWLAKIAHESHGEANPTPVTKKEGVKDQKVASKDLVVFHDGGVRGRRVNRVEQSKLSCENWNLFYFLRRKDVSKACFYHTLNLKRLGSFRRKNHSPNSVNMNKEDIAKGLCDTKNADIATHGGNKVLPFSDSSSSSNKSECSNIEKEEKTIGDKTKRVSRMKELLKWAAASRTEKKGKYSGEEVSHFKTNRAAIKGVPDNEDQVSTESPKISFSWDVESSSTIYSAAHSEISMASSLKHARRFNEASSNSNRSHVRDQRVFGTGNWIHTDSEFVVLEL